MPASRAQRYACALVRRGVSRRTAMRGTARRDGRFTLLTVDFHTTEAAVDLVRSFRRFVDPAGPAVVVQNGPRQANARLRQAGARCVGLGVNLGHGLGLDYGLRFVSTEYTLICDPDSAIVGPRFAEEVLARIAAAGAASIDNGAGFYHPICLAFPTETWKRRPISMEQHWPDWDVGGALTAALGGLRDDALLPRTNAAGPGVASTRPGRVHHYGELYGDVFTNTYCMSRKLAEPETEDFGGWTRSELDAYHPRWQRWVADVLADRASVADFPT